MYQGLGTVEVSRNSAYHLAHYKLMGVNALEKKEYLFLTHPTVYD
jgi:hypothetical protein